MSSLEGLNVGDEVLVYHGGVYGREAVEKITRQTAKQTIVGANRFWTRNGRAVGGDDWCQLSASPIKDGDKERVLAVRIRHQCLLRIKKTRFRCLSDDQLARISKILEEDK
jgi:hypothetical protein